MEGKALANEFRVSGDGRTVDSYASREPMIASSSNALAPLPELARRFGMSYPQTWRAAAAGEFACIMLGRKYLAYPPDFQRWAEARKADR